MVTVVPDPAKLLSHWNERERGETEPGRVLADLDTVGMAQLLARLAEEDGGEQS